MTVDSHGSTTRHYGQKDMHKFKLNSRGSSDEDCFLALGEERGNVSALARSYCHREAKLRWDDLHACLHGPFFSFRQARDGHMSQHGSITRLAVSRSINRLSLIMSTSRGLESEMTAENSDAHVAHELVDGIVSAVFRRPGDRPGSMASGTSFLRTGRESVAYTAGYSI